MACNKMLEVHDKFRLKPRLAQIRLKHDNALHDVPEKTPLVGVFGHQNAAHFVDLAYVVQKRRGKQRLPVELRIVIGHEHAQFATESMCSRSPPM